MPIYVSLHTCSVYFMAVVCVYIRAMYASLYRYGVCFIITWMWYMSTYVPIYASLHTCLVCYLEVVYVYIRACICLSKYVFGVLYDCGVILQTCRYMRLYIHVWYFLWLWYVPTYVTIYASIYTR